MIKPIGYLFLRWRLVVALLGGILAAMAMLFFALSVQSGAQTTGPVQAIAAGDKHALAIVNDPISGPGTVYAWGNNYYGQIGDGTRLNDRFPPNGSWDPVA
jgi:alpha-tubulin suppressor-like RCC1 family protein